MPDSFFPPADPDEAALAWFSKLRGDVPAQERLAFERWLAASPSHRAAFRRAESLWSSTGDAGLRVAAEEAPRLEAYLKRAESRRRGRALGQTGSALALALAVFAGAMWLERPHFLQDLMTDHVAPRGERRTVTLADSSAVQLNADAALDVDFSATERRVRLVRGTAFFSVAKTGTPFVVEAGGGEVRVLGTRFNIRTEENDALVTLAEGRVEVDAGASKAGLEPGQHIRVASGSLGEVAPADLDAELAWRDGRFVFYEARLADVVAEIARYRPGRIVITGDKLADWIVSGSLPLDDPDAALRSLQSTVGFSMRTIAGRLVVLN